MSWVTSLVLIEIFSGRNVEKSNKLVKYNQHPRWWGECEAKLVMVSYIILLSEAYIWGIKCIHRKFNVRLFGLLPLGCISVWVEVFEQVKYYLSSDGTSSRQVWGCVGLPSSLPSPRYLILPKTLALLDARPVACILLSVSVQGVCLDKNRHLQWMCLLLKQLPQCPFLTTGKNQTAVFLVLSRCFQGFSWPAPFTLGEHTLHWP